MKLVRSLCFLGIFVCGSVVAAAQAGNPITALEELVTAEKLTDATRHYPVAVEQALEGLDQKEKAEVANRLVIKQGLITAGFKLLKTSNPTQWEAVDATGENRITLTLINSFISGVDAFILMKCDFSNRAGGLKFVTTRFDAGEWRLESFGDWRPQIDFKSDDFIQGLTPAGRNETAAVATLEQICSALATYYATYRSAGYPSSLAALSGPLHEVAGNPEESPETSPQPGPPPPPPPEIEKPDVQESEEAGDSQDDSPAGEVMDPPQYLYLLPQVFMKEPLIKDGYEFHYKLIDPGAMSETGGQFQITATPLQYGKTGSKSYFVDQTGTTRFTTENRNANENDQPLNGGENEHFPDVRPVRK